MPRSLERFEEKNKRICGRLRSNCDGAHQFKITNPRGMLSELALIAGSMESRGSGGTPTRFRARLGARLCGRSQTSCPFEMRHFKYDQLQPVLCNTHGAKYHSNTSLQLGSFAKQPESSNTERSSKSLHLQSKQCRVDPLIYFILVSFGRSNHLLHNRNSTESNKLHSLALYKLNITLRQQST